jgi:hypothetical protein
VITYDDQRVALLLALIYPQDSRLMAHNRGEILCFGYEWKAPGTWLHRHGPTNLPRIDKRIEFAWPLDNDWRQINFRVEPYVRGSKTHRFFVECPSCGQWTTVGKYMLHAKIHRLQS